MFRRILVAACLTSVGLTSMTALPALAEEASLSGMVQTQIQDEVLWIEAFPSQVDGNSLQIRVYASRVKRAGRILWQRCEFEYSGPGTYRCGIDVSPGSQTANRSATWRAAVVLDDTLLAKKRFSIAHSR